MDNNYASGVFNGTVLIQQSATIGGAKNVFVKLQGQKDWLVYPTFGGKVMNPPKGTSKIFAGDLVEYRPDANGLNPKMYILRTFKVTKQSASTTEVEVERNGFRHIPFVGDILMKAPDAFATKGTAYKVTAVEETVSGGKDVWKLTFGTTLGALEVGDILVEADKESASDASMLVQNPNAVCAHDYDFVYYPLSTSLNKKGARYYFAPTLHGIMYTQKMSPLPKVVLDINKSNINGWFEL